DTKQRLVTAKERVTWINRHQRPATELVFNAHAHYKIPDKDIGLLAKMVELLRIAPTEAMTSEGAALEVKQPDVSGPLSLVNGPSQRTTDNAQRTPFHFAPDNATALVVPLPHAVGPGESVTVELVFTVRIPPKKGRWGQWDGVTTLAQWL